MRKTVLFLWVISFWIIACKQKPTTKPIQRDIVDAVFASGKAVSTNQYNITAYAEGYLDASWVSEGEKVKKSQPLFKLVNDIQQTQVNNALVNYRFAQTNLAENSPQLLQLQEQINQAVRKMQTDSINLNRYQNLIKTNAVARSDYDKVSLDYQSDLSSINVLQKAMADLRHNLSLNEANTKAQYQIQSQNNRFYTLVSEADGMILNIYKKNGDLVKKGETVANMRSGKIVARLFVSEDDINRVQMNQSVLISLNTDKDRVYKATVSKIYPAFDEASQSFLVEANFVDMPEALKDGTQLQANFIIGEKKNVWVIPTIYLTEGDSVLLANSHKKMGVKTGIKTLEWVEILSGITGEDVLDLPKEK